jgi:hypothetical protein
MIASLRVLPELLKQAVIVHHRLRDIDASINLLIIVPDPFSSDILFKTIIPAKIAGTINPTIKDVILVITVTIVKKIPTRKSHAMLKPVII